MKIETLTRGEEVTLRLTGRLGAHGGKVLAEELEGILRRGYRRIRLDLEALDYISSAGIRVLINYRQRLKDLKGVLIVCRVSEPVKKILDAAGFYRLLTTAPAEAEGETRNKRSLRLPALTMEIYELEGGGALSCEIIGTPWFRNGRRPSPPAFRSLTFPPTFSSAGVGALSGSAPTAGEEFGLFLAAGGVAACEAAGLQTAPDYMEHTEALDPMLQVADGIVLRGNFSRLVWFEKTDRGVGLFRQLLPEILKIDPQDAIGMVAVAEVLVLLGDALGPPRGKSGTTICYQDSTALIAGVAARRAPEPLAGWLEPAGRRGGLRGYLHAGMFSYRPLRKGFARLPEAVGRLFKQELKNIVHVRVAPWDKSGLETTRLQRGLIWFSPLK